MIISSNLVFIIFVSDIFEFIHTYNGNLSKYDFDNFFIYLQIIIPDVVYYWASN